MSICPMSAHRHASGRQTRASVEYGCQARLNGRPASWRIKRPEVCFFKVWEPVSLVASYEVIGFPDTQLFEEFIHSLRIGPVGVSRHNVVKGWAIALSVLRDRILGRRIALSG